MCTDLLYFSRLLSSWNSQLEYSQTYLKYRVTQSLERRESRQSLEYSPQHLLTDLSWYFLRRAYSSGTWKLCLSSGCEMSLGNLLLDYCFLTVCLLAIMTSRKKIQHQHFGLKPFNCVFGALLCSNLWVWAPFETMWELAMALDPPLNFVCLELPTDLQSRS